MYTYVYMLQTKALTISAYTCVYMPKSAFWAHFLLSAPRIAPHRFQCVSNAFPMRIQCAFNALFALPSGVYDSRNDAKSASRSITCLKDSVNT